MNPNLLLEESEKVKPIDVDKELREEKERIKQQAAEA